MGYRMRNYPNIDKSYFNPGDYVGYSAGKVWKIQKYNRGWQASTKYDHKYRVFEGVNLQEISSKLYLFNSEMKGENNDVKN